MMSSEEEYFGLLETSALARLTVSVLRQMGLNPMEILVEGFTREGYSRVMRGGEIPNNPSLTYHLEEGFIPRVEIKWSEDQLNVLRSSPLWELI